MTISWSVDPGEYLERITRQRIDAIERDIVRLVNRLSNQAATFMRQNARWTDRTGEARAGLYADVEHAVRESVTLLLSHGPAVPYAVWLEYAFSGKFEILSTTSDHFWPLLYRGVAEIAQRYSG